MSDFKDTTSWEKKDGTTLAYTYELDGKQHEGTAEKRPNSIHVQLDRISVLNETSWQLKDEKEPESETGYSTREYISALGSMDNCRLHSITLDENPNEVFSQLDVSIYPTELKNLVKTSTIDQFSFLRDEEDMPDEGWLSEETGRIHFHSDGEYHHGSQVFAKLLLSREKFDDLVEAIKAGKVRSARLDIFADLYEFDYESMGAGMPSHRYNYAILSKDEGESAYGTSKGSSGFTRARLQEVLLEWSPSLANRTASRRDEPDEDDYLEEDIELFERDVEKTVAKLSRDVQAIRGRIDDFFQAAIFIIVVLVIGQVTDWLGF
ncbi:hypothetical protein [uncultured Tateyamaria sp.]|uniref:hypothetical protein n=1 Tax=uncultured Tateyamaria sp. TaxID=455651 RepID=UPI00262C25CE|nr:hypothetical protein [uncultured Tateyamaria sp.]